MYQQQVASTWAASTSTLTIPSVKAPKNGYVYMYLSNRSDQHVYFDDFKVQITNGNILEENHYYSYGLKIAGISSKRLTDGYDGLAKNNYLYNDKELWDEGDLNWYDYGFRNYDPQIGRFTQLDPLTDDYPSMTPYQYASCEPIANVDLDGLEAANIIQLKEIVVVGRKIATEAPSTGSKIWGALKTIGNVAKDFVPFASAAINIYEGVRDGNWQQVRDGLIEGVVDAVLLPVGGSIAKGLIKTGVKQLVKNEAKTIVKRKADDLVRAVKNKVDDVKLKGPKNSNAIAEGKKFEADELEKSVSEGKNVTGRNRLVPQNGNGNVKGNRMDTDQLIKNNDGTFSIRETKRSVSTRQSKGQNVSQKHVQSGNGVFEIRTNNKKFGLKPGDKIKVKEFQRVNKYGN